MHIEARERTIYDHRVSWSDRASRRLLFQVTWTTFIHTAFYLWWTQTRSWHSNSWRHEWKVSARLSPYLARLLSFLPGRRGSPYNKCRQCFDHDNTFHMLVIRASLVSSKPWSNSHKWSSQSHGRVTSQGAHCCPHRSRTFRLRGLEAVLALHPVVFLKQAWMSHWLSWSFKQMPILSSLVLLVTRRDSPMYWTFCGTVYWYSSCLFVRTRAHGLELILPRGC